MKNHILKFGLIAGTVIVAIPVIAGFIIGYGPDSFKMGEIIGYSTMVLSLLVIFFASKEYQKQHPTEEVGFARIFTLGLGISAIAGLMFGIYNVIYVTYISPEFMDLYYEYYLQGIRDSGAAAEVITAQIAQVESEKAMFMNPVFNFFVMFATVFVIGVVISIVSGMFQRDQKLQQAVVSTPSQTN